MCHPETSCTASSVTETPAATTSSSRLGLAPGGPSKATSLKAAFPRADEGRAASLGRSAPAQASVRVQLAVAMSPSGVADVQAAGGSVDRNSDAQAYAASSRPPLSSPALRHLARRAAGDARARGQPGGRHELRQLAVGAGHPQHGQEPQLPGHQHRGAALPGSPQRRLSHGPLRRRHRSLERGQRRRRPARARRRTGPQAEPRGLRPERARRAHAADPDPFPGPLAACGWRCQGQHELEPLLHPHLRSGRCQRVHDHDLRATQPVRHRRRLRRLQRRRGLCRKRLPQRRSLPGDRRSQGLDDGLVHPQQRHRQRRPCSPRWTPPPWTASPQTATRN